LGGRDTKSGSGWPTLKTALLSHSRNQQPVGIDARGLYALIRIG
jgi:hypothetical protein